MGTTVFVVWLVIMAACLVFLVRNNKVYSSKMDTLDRVSDAAQADIWQQREWKWRYESFESAGYNEMLFKFWKPLDSFYPNDGFDDPNVFRKDGQ